MNEAQKKWTEEKCNNLQEYFNQHWPLSDAQWESVADYIEKVVNLAKGNAEVRSALFDVVEVYQRKAEEMKQ